METYNVQAALNSLFAIITMDVIIIAWIVAFTAAITVKVD